MKIEIDIYTLISIVTVFVTFVCGLIAKKVNWFNNKLIPIQNLLIGIIASIIYYIMTQDISLVITTIGLGTGGAYDLGKNLISLFNGETITEATTTETTTETVENTENGEETQK